MNILMDARGATTEEKQRGIEAARAVLDHAGITAEEAADGASAVERWDDMGFPPDQEPSEEEYVAAQAWWAASKAAMEACCVGWPDEKKHHVDGLQLLHDPDIQLTDRASALARMRTIVRAEDGKGEFTDNRVFFLALAATAEMPNSSKAQQLVSAVTVAYSSLSLAGFTPDEPIEPKRQAVLDAVDALEAGSASLN
ncbi:hypothetical protein FJ417_18690 [Mesorhizobium sp. B3-1-7]|uniref:hypothetical protein n=1 Tax=Mesorhizobium sp. B3-1-7 TaxID=2589894 RepID=UPI001125F99E|nr:hypothetical protein [Mesorhizobium sp. B3-1-7]TPI58651.1 hypothetical protein FJ417_18690 [Mesorhizobium sp. B3-1-7]